MAKAKAAPTTSIFGGAPVISIPTTASKSKAVEVNILGLQNVACLKAVIAALEAVCVEETRRVKDQMETHFLTEGKKLLRRPANFKGLDGIGSASCQLRASSTALNEDGIALCAEHNIPVEVDVKVAETFIVNPAYASDPTFVTKLEAECGPQLAKLADERGPIILVQQGQSKTKITEAGFDLIFTKANDVVREFLPIAFTQAIRAKLETGGDLKPALVVVEALLGTPLWKDIAEQAAQDASALEKKTKERASNKKTAAAA
jgi:hypothetical protein